MPPLHSLHNLYVVLQSTCRRSCPSLSSFACKHGLHSHSSLGNSLVRSFAALGCLPIAHQAFLSLQCPDLRSWNSLISAYVRVGDSHSAFLLYQQMWESLHPDNYTFTAILKACADVNDVHRGSEMHSHICRRGLLDSDAFLGSALVVMYSKCGSVSKAREAFNSLPVRNTVSWTALMEGYTENGYSEHALECFSKMQLEGVIPDNVTYLFALKACGVKRIMEKAQEIHIDVSKKGLETDLMIGSSLIDVYAKCGSLSHAQYVFDSAPVRNEVLWTTLIVGYADRGNFKEAVDQFKQMLKEGVCEDAAIYACVLKACGGIGLMEDIRDLHAQLVEKGMDVDVVVTNTLVDVYVKCGLLSEAVCLFLNIHARTTVSWNAIIIGCLEHGHVMEAGRYFKEMRDGIALPDALTYASCLKAFGITEDTMEGKHIHMEICLKGLERETFIGNSLIEMYDKVGLHAEAQNVFDNLLVRDVASWTLLILMYFRQGFYWKSLECFNQMGGDGVTPDAMTFVCCVKACGCIGSVAKAQEIHAKIRENNLEKDLILGSSLVGMYARCGLVVKAQEVFDNFQEKCVVSWNILIAGYAQLGESEQAINAMKKMMDENVQPNLVTSGIILNAYSYRGLIDEGLHYLGYMHKVLGMIPTIEHINCTVDLLSRAGLFDMALAFMRSMPYHPSLEILHSLLGACHKWNCVELSIEVFRHAVELDEADKATYVTMLNVYPKRWTMNCMEFGIEVVRHSN